MSAHAFARILAVALLAAAPLAAGESPAKTARLRCESMENPMGLDEARPRLSWLMGDARRGARQTAYRILVASSPEKLAADAGDLWDTGRVDSDRSIQIPYAGRPLASQQRCHWKVQIWDADGKSSGWSEPASWTMGPLDRAAWGAEWIAHAEPTPRALPAGHPAHDLALDGAQWIWPAGQGTPATRPKGTVFFRKTLDLPADVFVTWAYIAIAADDHFRLFLDGDKISESEPERCGAGEALEVELTEKLRAGRNVLALDVENYETGPAGLAAKIVVALSDGRRITSATDGSWKASLKPTGKPAWLSPELDDAGWPGAETIGPVGMAPWGKPAVGYRPGWRQRSPSPIFRKAFRVERPIRSATLHICGLGYHEAHINGKKVGDRYLDPAFTRYDRRALYATHDVTPLIREGDNALGVMLGNGWLNMHTRTTWNFDQSPWRKDPMLLAHLRIEFADGSAQTIVTDRSWRAGTGPLLNDSIFQGEVYDARRDAALAGWDAPGFDDSKWAEPRIAEGPGGRLAAQTMPPIRVTETIEPASITEPRPGTFVVDLGRAIAGWARLRASAPAGTEISLRYGERLDDRGLVERKEISKFTFAGPFQTDTYIFRGGAEETWEPRFVYHGFRYIQIEGFPGKLTKDHLRGRFAHTDFPAAGSFECSDDTANRIQAMTLASYRANYHGYPTDCPHREKNGWTGDAHLAAEQAMYNWDNGPAYAKWIQDIHDEQRELGDICAIIPTSGWGYLWGNGPAWDSAFLLIPWYMHLYLGDDRTLERHLDRMKRYVDYLTARSHEGIVSFGLGDWCYAKTVTPAPLTSTGYYHNDARIVAFASRIVGLAPDAAKYGKLADGIRGAFNREFGKPDGDYANGSQTALSCALHHDLVPAESRARAVARLAASVEAADGHIDCGILGVKYLFRALSDNGHHELAWRAATQKDAPGFGAWLPQGATTLWEDWPGKASRIHIMFGDISAWFYQYLAGIRPDIERPAFKHSIIRPMPAGDLRWVRAHTDTPHGTLRSSWRKQEDGSLQLEIVIPPNTTATLHIPAKDPARVTEGGKPAAESQGLKPLGAKDGCAVFEAVAGSYRFDAR
ncbi:MAG: family 78 glycoside hydrolase catalytic domain [Verrucomicrobiae bacterium]|nr:family 78 glycoside hydrolase catalytic domain [Verrucomicrobiae bacterium]